MSSSYPSSSISSISSISSTTSSSVAATATSYAANATIPITTTITSASSICVATLEGQILDAGRTALIYNANGDFITLNQSCHSSTMTTTSSEQTRATAGTVQSFGATSQTAQASATPHHRSSLPAATIAGLVVAVIVVLLAIVGFGCWLLYRRRRSRIAIITMPAKTLDEDASDQISIRWEKDGAEIKEMSAVRAPVEIGAAWAPVEIGDARSIKVGNGSHVELGLSISPVLHGQGKAPSSKLDGVVSPLSPLSPQ